MKRRKGKTKKNPLGAFFGSMDTTTWLMIGGAAVGAYLLWKKYQENRTMTPPGVMRAAPGNSIYLAPAGQQRSAIQYSGGYVPGRTDAEKAAIAANNARIMNDPRYLPSAPAPASGSARGAQPGYESPINGMDGLACPPGSDGSGNDAMYG